MGCPVPRFKLFEAVRAAGLGSMLRGGTAFSGEALFRSTQAAIRRLVAGIEASTSRRWEKVSSLPQRLALVGSASRVVAFAFQHRKPAKRLGVRL